MLCLDKVEFDGLLGECLHQREQSLLFCGDQYIDKYNKSAF